MFPRWLSWMFVVAIVYLIYTVNQLPHRAAPEGSASPTTQGSLAALAETVDVEQWKRTINPDYAATHNCSLTPPPEYAGLTLKVMEEHAGEGTGAACGETITVTLVLWNREGTPAATETLPLALGSQTLARGLDAGLLGLKPGGTRTLLLPPYAQERTAPLPASLREAWPQKGVVMLSVTRE